MRRPAAAGLLPRWPMGERRDTLFERLTEAMGQPDLAQRFKGHAERGKHQAEIDALISAWTATQETGALLKLMDERGVAAGLIYKAADMLEDPQYQARQSIVEVPHPAFGSVKMQNTFPMLSRTPGEVRWPGPLLGAHTEEVLRDALGLDAAAVAGLRSRGVI